MKNDKMCQSCGNVLEKKGGNFRGTEKNGDRSKKYCTQCYLNGEFTEPNISYEEMLQRGMNAIETLPVNKLTKWVYRKSYPKILKNIERWK